MNAQERVVRIRQLEKRYNRAERALEALEEGWRQYLQAQEDLRLLEDYYGGAWQEDYAADEAGRLPQDLQRGILAQDSLYDLLTKNDEIKKEIYEKLSFR